MFVDSHCHLEFPEFQADLDEVVSRAKKSGVECLLSIGTCFETFERILALTNRFSHVFSTLGIHPHEAEKISLTTLKNLLLEQANHPKVVGIGETGLDFYYHHSGRSQQIESFQTHIQVASQLNLPLVIHTRSAEKETIDILKEMKHSKGVIHCFTGTPWLAKQVLDLGFFISISGIVTFKNAVELQEVVRTIPLERLLLETDSPFLAPIPHRGKRNEPSFVVHVAEKIAELKGIPLEKVAKATTQNFFSLFSKVTL